MEMKKKTVILSLIYKFTERLCVKGLGLVISVVLARLLAPEDFGQVAILTVFINLSQVIVESGLTTALIQRKDVSERDYNTVFIINVILAVSLNLITGFTGLSLGGTSIMIVVGVALEIVQQIESQMMMRHYKGSLE